MIEVKGLVEENLADAEKVIRTRFGENGVLIARSFLKNPMRNGDRPYAGYLAYCDGVPQAFEGFALRRMFLKGQPIIGKVGGVTCAIFGSDEDAFVEVRLQNKREYAGSVIGFGNSLTKTAAHWASKSKNSFAGPESCSCNLYRAVRPLSCLAYAVRREILKKGRPAWPDFDTLKSLDFPGRVYADRKVFFDRLTARYAASCEGLVCSRTGEEIEWMFGERIQGGQSVVLGTSDAEGPTGAIVIGIDRTTARRFVIQDWIAVRNDLRTLEELLRRACRFVKECTPAIMIKTTGFPTFVQPLLRKYFPYRRDVGSNLFTWNSKALKDQLLPIIDTPKSWFFGPYDGDLVM